MSIYWIEFKSGPSGCVEADDEAVALVAARLATGREPSKGYTLPYPAEPRLVTKKHKWKKSDGEVEEYNIPSFCYRPNECKGRTSCPRRISCTE